MSKLQLIIISQLWPADEVIDKTKLTYQRKNLWRAPELLRLGDNCPSKGSVKGDVYSFGIILFQLVGEIGPWGTTNITQLGTRFYRKVWICWLTFSLFHACPPTEVASKFFLRLPCNNSYWCRQFYILLTDTVNRVMNKDLYNGGVIHRPPIHQIKCEVRKPLPWKILHFHWKKLNHGC